MAPTETDRRPAMSATSVYRGPCTGRRCLKAARVIGTHLKRTRFLTVQGLCARSVTMWTVSARPARVQFLVTCLVDRFFPDTGMAVVTVLERLGIEVQCPVGQTCC